MWLPFATSGLSEHGHDGRLWIKITLFALVETPQGSNHLLKVFRRIIRIHGNLWLRTNGTVYQYLYISTTHLQSKCMNTNIVIWLSDRQPAIWGNDYIAKSLFPWLVMTTAGLNRSLLLQVCWQVFPKSPTNKSRSGSIKVITNLWTITSRHSEMTMMNHLEERILIIN